MKKLLWIGDAVVSSGFARCTHEILETLRKTWSVSVLGLNYMGDPHQYPYPIFPCWPGGDAFGLGRVSAVVAAVNPDVVIVQNDPWNVPAYLEKLGKLPVIAVMPVDGKNVRNATELNPLAHAIFWTDFGLREARCGGFTGNASVIPLGVNLGTYAPRNTSSSRADIGLPVKYLDAFIVGNVNRNQPRKRLDLTLRYFFDWISAEKVEDAYLFLHVAPTGDQGYDIKQLAQYYGVKGRVILAEPEIGFGEREERMPLVYSSFDVQVSTTQGEGWGLTTLEGMACGIPQIVPDWSALGEWAKAAFLVTCKDTAVTPNNVNVVGGIPDEFSFREHLHDLYLDKELRARRSATGLELARQPQYRWESVGQRYAEILGTL